jgi:predicted small metal-binding protein|tara:strand:+ start:281 stop:568 length:288 start_codon:yes stop_codon:yes gene_type:complete
MSTLPRSCQKTSPSWGLDSISGQKREEIKMIRFARCNALLSLALDSNGKGCRYVAKGANDDEVVEDMGTHLTDVHQVEPGIMKYNILASTKTNNG